MSTQFDTAFVKQYHGNVFHLSQQMHAVLHPRTRMETQNSEEQFWDSIGVTTAREIAARHEDTVIEDVPHGRRRVTLIDSNRADLVDTADKVKALLDPTSDYIKSFQMALARKRDDQIIDAALGTAYTGKAGTTTVSMLSANTLAAFDGSTTTGNNLTTEALRAAKRRFSAQEVDPSIRLYFAFSSSQEFALLGETELVSADFNAVRALVNGTINSFMGFEFVRTERLDTTAAATTYTVTTGVTGSGTGTAPAGSRRCFAWAKDGILSAMGLHPIARVDERPDKNYSVQAYVQQSFGATRMEEEKVVEVICDEG